MTLNGNIHNIHNIHDSFVTSTRGLRRDIPPMILWERAKKLGVWNPSDIDFSQDTKDWEGLTDLQREYVKILCAQFIAGEEAVTLDLIPLIRAVAQSGHLEEEMYLTSFLWEESKHVDFFSRMVDSWGVKPSSLEQYHTEAYRTFFYDIFPTRMNALYDDPSPANLVRASTTYNLAIEGILAETGYYLWYGILDAEGILPGARTGLRHIQLDESRHIAYGVWLLSRLIAQDPSLYEIIPEVMDECLHYLFQITGETYERLNEMPFDFDFESVNKFGFTQYMKRLRRIRKSKGKTLEELYRSSDIVEEAGATA